MGKVYLHDIPIDTFIKYYLNDDLDSAAISLNARYQPHTENTTTKTYYQYVYSYENKLYSINTVDQLRLNYSTDQFNELFNFGSSDTNVTISIPKINSVLIPTLKNIKTDSDLTEIFNSSSYNKSTGKFTIDGTELDSIYSGDTGIKTSETDLPIYYIPLTDTVSRILHFKSLYKYYGKIKNKVFPAITRTDSGEFYAINEASDQSLLQNYFSNISIKNSLTLDTTCKCYYYSVMSTKTGLECGRIYSLPALKHIDYNSSGQAHFIDTYTGKDKYFNKNNLPLSPIIKYHNYMRSLKGVKTVQTNNNSIKYNETGKLYCTKYSDIYEIGYALRYGKIMSPAGDDCVISANNESTKYSKIESTLQTIDSKYDEINTFIKWFSDSEDIKLEIISDSDSVIQTNQETNKSVYPSCKVTSADVESLNYDFEIDTDSITSQIKTIFTTKNINIIRRYESNMDPVDQPYYSQGINIDLLETHSEIFSINLRTKSFYTKYSEYKKNNDFIIIDKISRKDYQASLAELLSDETTEIFYFNIVADNSSDDPYYSLQLTPLGTYLNNFIINHQSQYSSKDDISDGLVYKYFVDNSILTIEGLEGLSSLAEITKIFNKNNLYKSYTTMDSVSVSYGTSTLENMDYSSFKTIFPSIVNSINQTYSTNESMNKYNMNLYIKSLFNNLLNVVTSTGVENSGGYCYDVYSGNTYHGFIDYRSNRIYYDYSKAVVDEYNNEKEVSSSQEKITLDDMLSIEAEVENKNVFDRLFNYKEYTINAEEIRAKEKNLLYKKKLNSTITQEKQPVSISSTSIRTDSPQYFEVQDIFDKSFDLITEYLYSDNRNTMGENDDTYVVDYYASETDKSKQSFYRRDYTNCISKIMDENNQTLIDECDDYKLRYTFQNTKDDREVFLMLLKLINTKDKKQTLK